MKFIELHLGSHRIVHGFDSDQKEIIEEVVVPSYSVKLVAIKRIKSISEKYILIDYLEGRWVYWEYEEDYELVKKQIKELTN